MNKGKDFKSFMDLFNVAKTMAMNLKDRLTERELKDLAKRSNDVSVKILIEAYK